MYMMQPMEREVNQVLWQEFMGELGQNPDNEFENDIFTVKAYDWSDEGDNDWHFWHKPSGLKLMWYKYPLRGVMSNMSVTHEQFIEVLKDCWNSRNEYCQYGVNDEWWKGR